MKQASERRHFWRSVFHSPVRFNVGADKLQAQLLDVSLKGALLEIAQPWSGPAGAKGMLQFDLGEGVSIAMQTSVATPRASTWACTATALTWTASPTCAGWWR